MRAHEIHLVAEKFLEEPLLRKSVKGTLSNYSQGHRPRFVRVGRGVYQLADAAAGGSEAPQTYSTQGSDGAE